MADADTFLSDVHIGTFCTASDQGTLVSRFVFTLSPHNTSEAEPDKDGDMVVVRKTQHVIFIEHAMSTTLEAVGLQVWRGSLLMADYILYHGDRLLSNTVVLELGAGTGLVSIVAGLKARHVYCTDTGKCVLDLCQKNVDHNASDVEGCRNVKVRELDWKEPFSGSSTGFSWSQDDMASLSKVSIILASDVVYDNSLTDAFFTCLVYLHSIICQPPTTLISLEKRVNFSLEDLATVSPYYHHFRECLELSYPFPSGSKQELKFQVQQIDTDSVPQYSMYERVKELELWELKASITNGC